MVTSRIIQSLALKSIRTSFHFQMRNKSIRLMLKIVIPFRVLSEDLASLHSQEIFLLCFTLPSIFETLPILLIESLLWFFPFVHL